MAGRRRHVPRTHAKRADCESYRIIDTHACFDDYIDFENESTDYTIIETTQPDF